MPKTIELYKDEILTRLQQSAEKTPVKRVAEKMVLQRGVTLFVIDFCLRRADLISAGVKRSMPLKETSKIPPRKAQKMAVLDGDHVFAVEIDRNIYVTVSEFKGKMRADLRRYYMVHIHLSTHARSLLSLLLRTRTLANHVQHRKAYLWTRTSFFVCLKTSKI